MKLDKIKFARLISYLSRFAGGVLCDTEIETIDSLIDINVEPVPTPYVEVDKANELLRAIHAGEKIAAIKAYRSLTCMGLKESKDAVEDKWLVQGYTKQQMLNKSAMKSLTIEEAKTIDKFINEEFL